MNKRVWNGRYVVQEKNKDYATIKCAYQCPYCGEENKIQLTIHSEAYELIDNGGFYEPLTCEYCGQEADVIFGQ